MKNSNVPIYGECPNSSDPAWAAAKVGGLTKREYFAGLALQGLAHLSWEVAAERAVKMSDSLLEELEK